MRPTPTARTIEWCSNQGWIAGEVERRIPHTHIRIDLFGCIDVECLDDCFGVLGIQVTTASNAAARMTKARAEPRLLQFLKRNNRFHVHGWRSVKAKAKGERVRWVVNRWRAVIDSLGTVDFERIEEEPGK